ncbi:MAG: hypothetical protein HY290_21785 [Planctomycetia bacterium]|nr:hypothetical protein [Planctomycetia bacterium]
MLGCYSLNQHQAPSESTITVICESGTVRCEIHNNRWMWMERPGEAWHEEPFGPAERDAAFVAQAHAFLDAIDGKAKVLCTLDEGIQTLRVNLAILESATKHTWENVAYT